MFQHKQAIRKDLPGEREGIRQQNEMSTLQLEDFLIKLANSNE